MGLVQRFCREEYYGNDMEKTLGYKNLHFPFANQTYNAGMGASSWKKTVLVMYCSECRRTESAFRSLSAEDKRMALGITPPSSRANQAEHVAKTFDVTPVAVANALTNLTGSGIVPLTEGYRGELKTVFRSGLSAKLALQGAEKMEFTHFF
jgi:hypothetical protein